MGERGPVPKHSSERLGHRAKGDRPDTAPSGLDTPLPSAPPGNPEWEDLALSWYNSLGHSGQSRFYEPSDWATAQFFAEVISRELGEKFVGIDPSSGQAVYATAPVSGPVLNAFLKASTALLATEGDRRRAQLELRRANQEGEREAQILSIVKDDVDEAFG